MEVGSGPKRNGAMGLGSEAVKGSRAIVCFNILTNRDTSVFVIVQGGPCHFGTVSWCL